jgi:integrase
MTVIKWVIKQQLLPRDILNVFETISLRPYQKKEKGAAPLDIVLQVVVVADAECKDLRLAYLLTGARKTELLTMVWAVIDFGNRTYLLPTKKSGTGLAKTTRHNMSELLCELFRRKLDGRHLELEILDVALLRLWFCADRHNQI